MKSSTAKRSYTTAPFRCPFPGCKKACKKPGGLTQHKDVCAFNPVNSRQFSPQSRTPSPFPWETGAALPRTPSPHLQQEVGVPPTPSNTSPRRTVWQTNGRSGIFARKHQYLDGIPCDSEGFDLPLGSPPPPLAPKDPTDYFPFTSEEHFQIADFCFSRLQISAGNMTMLMDLWAALQQSEGGADMSDVPFKNAKDLYDTIDSIPIGDIPWEGFKVTYDGELPEKPPTWMTKEYDVWFRDPLEVLEAQISNPDFANEMDYAPKEVFGSKKKTRQYTDLMSGQWAWEQADIIAEDPDTHGAMFAPVVLGSDKTTVSVATGQNDYYPLYMSLGNVQNHVRHAHRNAVALIGFLAMPKMEKHEQDSLSFRRFRRQLFHSSLAHILMSLKPWMSKTRVTLCGDGHYRRVIYGLGPYIADYPEQCLLTCVVSGWCPRCTALSTELDKNLDDAVQRSPDHTDALMESVSNDAKRLWEGYGIIADVVPFTAHFPRANIHDLISPDLLHQIIKGTFKDHLVAWVEAYFKMQDDGKELLAEMDRRIAAVPPCPGLRRFPEGRGFKQWTGNDSKALMKVFLPAITGLVPDGMVRAIGAFLEFCYLVRRSQIDETVLEQIDNAVYRFHQERQIFIRLGIREDFLLPRQHSIAHYRYLIQRFGAPNGLCSSITESKHIKAVKEPYRRSSRNEPLGEMILTNQRLEKLSAARIHFERHGMLNSVQGNPQTGRRPLPIPEKPKTWALPDEDADEEDVEGVTVMGDVRFPKRAVSGYPKTISSLAYYLQFPKLSEYIRRFLYDQQHPDSEIYGMDVDLSICPKIHDTTRIHVYHSASTLYHAPSDLSGIGGMHREYIRATPSWKRGPPRHDTVYIEKDAEQEGFRGLGVAQVRLFFSFNFNNTKHDCALVQWFETHGDMPCPTTGLWRVRPDIDASRRRVHTVIHIDSIIRTAHLIGISGISHTPYTLTPARSLHAFKSYYVNKYADYHAHEIAF